MLALLPAELPRCNAAGLLPPPAADVALLEGVLLVALGVVEAGRSRRRRGEDSGRGERRKMERGVDGGGREAASCMRCDKSEWLRENEDG